MALARYWLFEADRTLRSSSDKAVRTPSSLWSGISWIYSTAGRSQLRCRAIIWCGNRDNSQQEAKQYAESNGCLFFEASAKDGKNVVEVFRAIGALRVLGHQGADVVGFLQLAAFQKHRHRYPRRYTSSVPMPTTEELPFPVVEEVDGVLLHVPPNTNKSCTHDERAQCLSRGDSAQSHGGSMCIEQHSTSPTKDMKSEPVATIWQQSGNRVPLPNGCCNTFSVCSLWTNGQLCPR